MMNRTLHYAALAFGLGLGLNLGLVGLLAAPEYIRGDQTRDGYTVYYVAPGGDCGDGALPCYDSLQTAVDAADEPADAIKVAGGVYTDVHQRSSVTQVVYISKTLSIQGGYTTTNWEQPDPAAYPTRLDAQGQGRVLYITGVITLNLEGLTLTNGDARRGDEQAHNGGGACIISASVFLRNNAIVSNTARFGGGLFLAGSAARLQSNTLQRNVADYGGGLHLTASPTHLASNTIASNIGNQYGGGLVVWDSAASLEGNHVLSNAATYYGGGLYLYADQVQLKHNVIANNQATQGNGGGLAIMNLSQAWLDGNDIRANSAGGDGGGLYLLANGPRFDSNRIVANTANQGGGLYLYQSHTTLTNTLIADNQAHSLGSGLYARHTTAHLRHTTLARNAGGDGSGLYIADEGGWGYSQVALTNTILVSQAVGLVATAGNTASLHATLWNGNSANQAGDGLIDIGTLNYTGDPAFVSPAGLDYHLRARSAAIDHGVDAGVRMDMDGEIRPQGNDYDLGADEFKAAAALLVRKTAAPSPVQAGAALTYTITVTNSGTVDLYATVTDTLPLQIMPGALAGGTAISPGGQITWTTGIITPGAAWRYTFAVTVAANYAGPLANLVEVTAGEGVSSSHKLITWVGSQAIYLPLISKEQE